MWTIAFAVFLGIVISFVLVARDGEFEIFHILIIVAIVVMLGLLLATMNSTGLITKHIKDYEKGKIETVYTVSGTDTLSVEYRYKK